LASHSARRRVSDENLRGWYGGGGRVKDLRVARLDARAFRSCLDPPAAAGVFALRFSSPGTVAGRREMCRTVREGCSRQRNLLKMFPAIEITANDDITTNP